ncbi:MAG: hypothetical protein LQ337_004790 [Flavoplaca oasis]|nr:MAG: hypothetical protein LQ337_004790 [Flavoplaca oasis]
MKSIIVSAFFGTALLAIQGVSGAAVPTDVVERNEAFQVSSENIKSLAVKRAPLPDVSSTNICIHNTDGSVECSDVMIKHENVPYKDTLEKRKMKFRDNYEDKAGENVLHVLASRDVANGDRSAKVPGAHAPYPKDKRVRRSDAAYQLETRDTAASTGDQVDCSRPAAGGPRGCSGFGNPYYFESQAHMIECNAELVKGSQASRQYNPGSFWDTRIMQRCFRDANCVCGLSFSGNGWRKN